MSENRSGFTPFNTSGEDAKVDAYSWGFNFKSIKGANTDVTYGWKGSGVFGLSTSVYVNPVAALGLAAAGGIGAGVGAAATGIADAAGEDTNAAEGADYGATAALAGTSLVYTLLAMSTEVSKSDWLYDKMISMTRLIYPGAPVRETNLSLRNAGLYMVPNQLMNIPTYMTVEIGAKTDAIYGNKWDFVTGSVNKMVNGETVQCYADKVEWYHANLYKYIKGKETKMEWKGATDIGDSDDNAVRDTIYSKRNEYVEAYNEFSQKSTVATQELKQTATDLISQSVAGGNYTLSAKTSTATVEDDFKVTTTAGAINLEANNGMELTAGNGKTIKLTAGTDQAIEISSAQTKINNQLALGMPGMAPPLIVAEAMALLKQQQSNAAMQLVQAKSAMHNMQLRMRMAKI